MGRVLSIHRLVIVGSRLMLHVDSSLGKLRVWRVHKRLADLKVVLLSIDGRSLGVEVLSCILRFLVPFLFQLMLLTVMLLCIL